MGPVPNHHSGGSNTGSPTKGLSYDVGQSLREISRRLGRLESVILQRPVGTPRTPGSHADVSDIDESMEYQDHTHPAADDPSPLTQVELSVGGVTSTSNLGSIHTTEGDAISRGLITVDMAKRLFEFYFDSLNPLFPVADIELDRDAMSVRRRSTLLFHTILSQSAYFLFLHDAPGRLAYRGLTGLLSDALGRILLFAKAKTGAKMTRDVAVALLLCIIRKNIYTDSDDDPNTEISLSRQIASKLNYDMGFMIVGLANRALCLLGFNQTSQRLLDAVEIGVQLDASQTVVQNLKLWLHHTIVDANGAVQGSRAPTCVSQNCARAASSLADILPTTENRWIAAMVNLALLTKEHFGRPRAGSDRRLDVQSIADLQKQVARWSNIWMPYFDVQRGQVEFNIAWFRRASLYTQACLLQLSATASLLRRYTTGPVVEGETEVVRESINAAKNVLRALSGNSASTASTEPDHLLASMLSRAADHPLCIILPFFSLFLVKHTAGDPDIPDLLLLTATFLEASAPNATHPAVAHARMLRSCIPASRPSPSMPVQSLAPSKNGTTEEADAFFAALLPNAGSSNDGSFGNLLPLLQAEVFDWNTQNGLAPFLGM